MGDIMKKKLLSVVLILMCFSWLIGLSGCEKKTGVHSSEQHSSAPFATYTQEEKINYVVDYLKTQYGLTTEISEIKKRQVNSFSSEEMYYAIAKYNENSRIYCWISDNGKISDSKFINDLQIPVNRLFSEKISDKLNDCQVICSCTLNSPTEKTWTEDRVVQMLSTEDISVSVRIFVNNNEKEKAEVLVSNAFDGAFSFATGRCYIYFTESTETDFISGVDLTNYDLNFEFKKD